MLSIFSLFRDSWALRTTLSKSIKIDFAISIPEGNDFICNKFRKFLGMFYEMTHKKQTLLQKSSKSFVWLLSRLQISIP